MDIQQSKHREIEKTLYVFKRNVVKNVKKKKVYIRNQKFLHLALPPS